MLNELPTCFLSSANNYLKAGGPESVLVPFSVSLHGLVCSWHGQVDTHYRRPLCEMSSKSQSLSIRPTGLTSAFSRTHSANVPNMRASRRRTVEFTWDYKCPVMNRRLLLVNGRNRFHLLHASSRVRLALFCGTLHVIIGPWRPTDAGYATREMVPVFIIRLGSLEEGSLKLSSTAREFQMIA